LSFSLLTEPWIPVIRQDQSPDKVGLRQALLEAHAIHSIHDPSPLVTVALHRLLMAVLYRAPGIPNEAAWRALWKADRLPAAEIGAYLDRWADRFDLLHPTRPFFQVTRIADEKEHPIAALVIEAASGNNALLFDHGLVEGEASLPLDRAACHLLAHQQFAVGGGVSKPFNRMDGPVTKGVVLLAHGQSLKETLLLNALPVEHWPQAARGSGGDRAFWELDDPPEPDQQGTRPLGPAHYLTWQSRQIHLLIADGQAVGCQIRQRYCLPKGQIFDPARPHRADEKLGILPVKVDKSRVAWQMADSLLAGAGETGKEGLTEWLAWVAVEAGKGKIECPQAAVVSINGLTTGEQAAKIDLWRREIMALPFALLRSEDLLRSLYEGIRLARRADQLLAKYGQALAWGLGEPGRLADVCAWFMPAKGAQPGKLPPFAEKLARTFGLQGRYWATLEPAFRDLCRDLPALGEIEAMALWREQVQASAREAVRTLRPSLLDQAAHFEVVAQLESRFDRMLKSRLQPQVADGGEQDE
jgi:CRISPR system Cascade subunit CasA